MTDRKTIPPRRKSAIIDWSTVHHRLADAQARVAKSWAPTPAEQKKILKARAKALAQEPLAEQIAGEQIEIVEFLLAYERYGVESSHVREIYPLKELTPVPCTPAFVLGIVNVRGQILSVIDIKKFFDLPEKGLTDLNKVIILQSGEMEFGILADAVFGVRSIPRAEMQTSLPTFTGIRENYFIGMTKERVVILDAAKLLSDRNIIVQDEVEA
ncbi:MAG: chemotaxis protein CheW [Sulfuricaulis sp.]